MDGDVSGGGRGGGVAGGSDLQVVQPWAHPLLGCSIQGQPVGERAPLRGELSQACVTSQHSVSHPCS